jgi:WD40 repeat protein
MTMTPEATTSFDRERLLDEVVTAYLKEVQAGRAPDPDVWLSRYPQLAPDLAEFLADRAALERLAVPLRSLAQAGLPAKVVGDYEILEEFARSGMGVVYKARQISLDRIVALKMVQPGGRSPEDLERFLHTEARAVASLDHRHIVPVYDFGVHDGRPFFSMKLMEGGSLDQHLLRFRDDPRAIARLVTTAARAVHHAHQRGLLHRDLKPANILVAGGGCEAPDAATSGASYPPLAELVPYVTDFGLAKRVADETTASEVGVIVGTPSYMAPEQAAGEPVLTTAVDVYGLGGILYALLTGQAPFRAGGILDVVRLVRTREPARPRSLNPKADRDLETICLKCLEKDPAKRYGSAEALADDLERWLGGEPIRARRIGAWEHALKWACRRPAVAALAGSIVCLGLCLLGFALWGWQNAVLAGQAADGRADAEEKAHRAAQKEAKALEEARREAAARAAEARRKTRLVEAHLALERAMNHCRRDEVAAGLVWLARGLEVVSEDEAELQLAFRRLLRGWSRHLHVLKQVLPITGIPLARSPDGKVLATGRVKPGGVQLWDAGTGKALGPPIALPGVPRYVAFNPQGKLLVIAWDEESPERSPIQFWDFATRRPIGEPINLPAVAQRGNEYPVALSPDGKRLFAVYQTRHAGRQVSTLRFWEVPTGRPIGDPVPLKQVPTAVFSPDGKTLLTAGPEVRFWDARTGKAIGEPVEPGDAATAAFSPDGKTFLTAGFSPNTPDGPVSSLRHFETASRKLISEHRQRKPVDTIAFGSDGESILVWSRGEELASRLVQMFRCRPGINPIGAPIPTSRDSTFAFTADGKAVVLVNELRQLRLWDTQTGGSLGDIPETDYVFWVGSDLGAKTMLTSTNAGIRRWEIACPPTGRKLEGSEQRGLDSPAFSPDGKRLAMIVSKVPSEVRFWDPLTARPTCETIPGGDAKRRFCYLTYSRDGKLLLTVDAPYPPDKAQPATVRLWDSTTRKSIGDPIPVQWPSEYWMSRGHTVAIRPDSKRLVVAFGKVARLYDTATGRPVGKTLEHREVIRAVAFSPDGKRILTGGEDKSAGSWDAATGRPVGDVLKHVSAVDFVAFSPDGKTVLTTDQLTVRLWNAATGQPIGEPIRSWVWADCFSPNGRTVLIGAPGPTGWGVARLWDAETGKPCGRYLHHEAQITDVALSPDGRTILTASIGSYFTEGVQLWDVATSWPIGKVLWTHGFDGLCVDGMSTRFSPDSRTVLAKATLEESRRVFQGNLRFDEARFFDVPQPVAGDAARIRLWVEVITSRELDAGGEIAELDAKTWHERWKQLQQLGGPP